MKKIIWITVLIALFSPWAMAEDAKIGYVDVVSLFNKSSFVVKANKDLQENAKKMEQQLQTAKTNLQAMMTDYENATVKKKKDKLAKDISTAQANLTKMNQEYQQKLQEEQAAGLKKFTQMVQTAVEKVAKKNNISTVINSNAILYTDKKDWKDITVEVSKEIASEPN